MIPELVSMTDDSPEAILALNSIQGLIEDCTNPALVILTINGQQTSFLQMVKSITDNYEMFVEERAKELVKERTINEVDKIIKSMEILKEKMKDSLRDSGFKNIDDDSEYWYD
jgi:hypothetical protein